MISQMKILEANWAETNLNEDAYFTEQVINNHKKKHHGTGETQTGDHQHKSPMP